MTKTQLREMGEDVRAQGRPEGAPSKALSNLVYDLDTGEFTCVRGDEPVPARGAVVTEMTRQGFAAHE